MPAVQSWGPCLVGLWILSCSCVVLQEQWQNMHSIQIKFVQYKENNRYCFSNPCLILKYLKNVWVWYLHGFLKSLLMAWIPSSCDASWLARTCIQCHTSSTFHPIQPFAIYLSIILINWYFLLYNLENFMASSHKWFIYILNVNCSGELVHSFSFRDMMHLSFSL